jgi:hypothetical protein
VAGPPSPRPVRIAAWLITGPLGHLCAGLADLGAILARVAWARARGRRVDWDQAISR